MNSCANLAVTSCHKHKVPTLCQTLFLDKQRERENDLTPTHWKRMTVKRYTNTYYHVRQMY